MNDVVARRYEAIYSDLLEKYTKEADDRTLQFWSSMDSAAAF